MSFAPLQTRPRWVCPLVLAGTTTVHENQNIRGYLHGVHAPIQQAIIQKLEKKRFEFNLLIHQVRTDKVDWLSYSQDDNMEAFE